MHNIIVMLAFVAHAYAKGLMVHSGSEAQHSFERSTGKLSDRLVHKLVDKMFDRSLKASRLQDADLKNVVLAKPSAGAIQSLRAHRGTFTGPRPPVLPIRTQNLLTRMGTRWGQRTSMKGHAYQDDQATAVQKFFTPPKQELPFDAEMPINEHLEELRERALSAGAALFLTVLVAFAFSKDLIVFLEGPVRDIKFLQLSPGEFFYTTLKVSSYTGLLLSIPTIAYQIGAWVAPGLTVQEKRALFPIFIGSALLFFFGIYFSYQVIVPAALGFFVDFASGAVETAFSIDQYFEFVLLLMIGVGVSFQIPVVQVLLGQAGIITSEQIFGNWRYVAVGATLLAAVLTPSADPFTQILFTIPLLGLYTGGGLAVKAIEESRKQPSV